jgi:hypothetical protein
MEAYIDVNDHFLIITKKKKKIRRMLHERLQREKKVQGRELGIGRTDVKNSTEAEQKKPIEIRDAL